MIRSSEAAIAFLNTLTSLAQRLAKRDVVVSQLECYLASFGGWTFQVQRGPEADAFGAALLRREYDVDGPEVVRFAWDGKEKLLFVSRAQTKALSRPGPWKRVVERSFEGTEQAFAFAEDYVLKWAAGAA
jgi:hypothetical protein